MFPQVSQGSHFPLYPIWLSSSALSLSQGLPDLFPHPSPNSCSCRILQSPSSSQDSIDSLCLQQVTQLNPKLHTYLDVGIWGDELLQALNRAHEKGTVGRKNLEKEKISESKTM